MKKELSARKLQLTGPHQINRKKPRNELVVRVTRCWQPRIEIIKQPPVFLIGLEPFEFWCQNRSVHRNKNTVNISARQSDATPSLFFAHLGLHLSPVRSVAATELHKVVAKTTVILFRYRRPALHCADNSTRNWRHSRTVVWRKQHERSRCVSAEHMASTRQRGENKLQSCLDFLQNSTKSRTRYYNTVHYTQAVCNVLTLMLTDGAELRSLFFRFSFCPWEAEAVSSKASGEVIQVIRVFFFVSSQTLRNSSSQWPWNHTLCCLPPGAVWAQNQALLNDMRNSGITSLVVAGCFLKRLHYLAWRESRNFPGVGSPTYFMVIFGFICLVMYKYLAFVVIDDTYISSSAKSYQIQVCNTLFKKK